MPADVHSLLYDLRIVHNLCTCMFVYSRLLHERTRNLPRPTFRWTIVRGYVMMNDCGLLGGAGLLGQTDAE